MLKVFIILMVLHSCTIDITYIQLSIVEYVLSVHCSTVHACSQLSIRLLVSALNVCSYIHIVMHKQIV